MISVVPDGLEPSFSACKSDVVAAGPRDSDDRSPFVVAGVANVRSTGASILPAQGDDSSAKSALWESNPPRRFGRPVPLPLGQGHVIVQRKERESNPQGLAARLFSRQLPSPVGLPFQFGTHESEKHQAGIEPAFLLGKTLFVGFSCRVRARAAVAGIEPASRRLTAAGPYQHRPHRNIRKQKAACLLFPVK